MDAMDSKELIHEALDERCHIPNKKFKTVRQCITRNQITTSKALIFFSSVMYALTWVVAVYSWFTTQILPEELMRYVTYLYGASLAIYGGKSAYENKAKIDRTHEEAMQEKQYP